MSNDVYEVLNVIYSVMGSESRKHNRSKFQISYNCPVCDGNKNKGNLEINYNRLLMKCWSCGEVPGGLKGSLYKLIKEFGNHRELRLYKEATEDFHYEETEAYHGNYIPDIKLPKEYKIIDPNTKVPSELQAYNYLKGRGISDSQISKYEVGYCGSGKYSGRIVIPSFDKDGNLNFFVSRTYTGHKQKYDNPEVLKTEIIVNEMNINWDSTVFLVEGMFDMIGLGLSNTIPLLGKVLPDKLYDTLTSKCNGYVVVCLDPDATQDAYQIYQKLDTSLKLSGRVRVMDLPLNKDIAEIRELYGDKGVIRCIKKMRKLELSDKLEYDLV